MDHADVPKLVKPYDALNLLEHLYGGSIDAKKLIADKIRDGEIKAFAKRSWVSREPSLRLARNAKPPQTAAEFTQIDRKKLIGADSWVDEASRWKWRRGIFHSVANGDPVKRRIFKGVRLAEEDILRLVAKAREARQKDASNAGAPSKAEASDNVWLAILECAIKRQLTKDNLGSQKKWARTLSNELAIKKVTPAASPTAIAAIVSKVYARFFAGSVN